MKKKMDKGQVADIRNRLQQVMTALELLKSDAKIPKDYIGKALKDLETTDAYDKLQTVKATLELLKIGQEVPDDLVEQALNDLNKYLARIGI